MKLSVIIPVYNEESTVGELLEQVLAVDIPKEVIVVDDGSRDGTIEIVKEKAAATDQVVQVHTNEVNVGKGAAIRRGLLHVTGDVVLIQDADLELDPNEYHLILEPFLSGKADVVYGSRFRNRGYFIHYKQIPFMSRLGNWGLAFVVNLFWPRARITDEATAYKAFRADLIKSLNLKCNAFDFCPEVTAKVLNRGIRIYEVPITYHPRTVEQGKKVSWKDGIKAVWKLFKYRFLERDTGI
ncbi:MAG TPA: glycosyltransferase family 2 protein [Firmicutes bacterium]|nr:glycosyltransferase family 2 protein [Bacillota bacterium]